MQSSNNPKNPDKRKRSKTGSSENKNQPTKSVSFRNRLTLNLGSSAKLDASMTSADESKTSSPKSDAPSPKSPLSNISHSSGSNKSTPSSNRSTPRSPGSGGKLRRALDRRFGPRIEIDGERDKKDHFVSLTTVTGKDNTIKVVPKKSSDSSESSSDSESSDDTFDYGNPSLCEKANIVFDYEANPSVKRTPANLQTEQPEEEEDPESEQPEEEEDPESSFADLSLLERRVFEEKEQGKEGLDHEDAAAEEVLERENNPASIINNRYESFDTHLTFIAGLHNFSDDQNNRQQVVTVADTTTTTTTTTLPLTVTQVAAINNLQQVVTVADTTTTTIPVTTVLPLAIMPATPAITSASQITSFGAPSQTGQENEEEATPSESPRVKGGCFHMPMRNTHSILKRLTSKKVSEPLVNATPDMLENLEKYKQLIRQKRRNRIRQVEKVIAEAKTTTPSASTTPSESEKVNRLLQLKSSTHIGSSFYKTKSSQGARSPQSNKIDNQNPQNRSS